MLRDFLEKNPDCADKVLRHGVAWMRDAGFTEDEIRAHLDELHECGHLEDVDFDNVLQ